MSKVTQVVSGELGQTQAQSRGLNQGCSRGVRAAYSGALGSRALPVLSPAHTPQPGREGTPEASSPGVSVRVSLGVSVSLSWRLQASVLLRDLRGQCVSVCGARPCVSRQRLVAGFPWVFVSRYLHTCARRCRCLQRTAVSRSLCFVASKLNTCLPAPVSRCLSCVWPWRVSVTGFCGSVYVSDALGLPISVPVCHCVCPPMCHHLPRCPVCFTHRPGHRWACQAHWCPGNCSLPIHPRPAMGQAGRLFAMPAPGKHQDQVTQGHLHSHLRSLPLSPGLGWPRGPQAAPLSWRCALTFPPPTVPTFPSPQPWPLPACLPAFVAPWLSAGFLCFFLSPLPLTCISLWFILWNDPCLHSVPSTSDSFCLFSGKSDFSPFLVCL